MHVCHVVDDAFVWFKLLNMTQSLCRFIVDYFPLTQLNVQHVLKRPGYLTNIRHWGQKQAWSLCKNISGQSINQIRSGSPVFYWYPGVQCLEWGLFFLSFKFKNNHTFSSGNIDPYWYLLTILFLVWVLIFNVWIVSLIEIISKFIWNF